MILSRTARKIVMMSKTVLWRHIDILTDDDAVLKELVIDDDDNDDDGDML